jgi:hypothetical protein
MFKVLKIFIFSVKQNQRTVEEPEKNEKAKRNPQTLTHSSTT